MKQTSTRDLLVLDAFLRDMDSLDTSVSPIEELSIDDRLLSDEFSAVSDAGTTASSPESSKTLAKHKTMQAKRKRSQRLQIQDLRHEIESLMVQVESLHANQLLGDSLEQFLNPEQYRPNYRLLATDEKQLCDHAQAENARLKKHLRKNLRLGNAVRKAMQRAQTQYLSAIGPQHSAMSMCDNKDEQICNMLRANLDRRYRNLDQVLSQCMTAASPGELSEVVVHADGCGVDFKDSRVLPFDVKSVCDALCESTDRDASLRTFDGRGLYVKKEALSVHLGSKYGPSRATEQRDVQGRFLLRRIEESHRTVLLWESMDEWPLENTAESSVGMPAFHGASWAVVEPLPELGERVSLLQAAFSIRVREGSGGNGAIDPALRRVLHVLEKFYIRQRQMIGNLLMDMSVKDPYKQTISRTPVRGGELSHEPTMLRELSST